MANNTAHVGGSFENLNADGTSLEVTGGLKYVGASSKVTTNNGANSVSVNPDAPVRNVDVGANTFTIHLTGSG